MVGTVEYMSPEQADGKPVDARSDLYSLGGVLFAMLAGRPPFRGKSLPEILQMQRFAEPPRATQFAPETPAALADIIARLLSKSPTDRAANAGILARELSAMEHGLAARSTRTRAEEAFAAGEFSLSQSETMAGEAAPVVQEEVDPDSPTRYIVDPTTQAAPNTQSGRTAGSSFSLDAPLSPARQPRANRFLTIEQESAEAAALERGESRRRAIQQFALLATVLGIIGLTVWLATRPASPDEQYRKLETAAADGDRSASVVSQMEAFVERLPDDPRRAQVEKWLADARLERLERNFRVRAAHEDDDPRAAIAREYVAAVETSNVDPERSAARLRALREVYANDAELEEDDRLCLELAKRQIERLEGETLRRAKLDAATIRERIVAIERRPAAERAAVYRADDALRRSAWAGNRTGGDSQSVGVGHEHGTRLIGP
ncbi:MAG: hypothetical protein QM811_20860 [Pirellulales bacterium]